MPADVVEEDEKVKGVIEGPEVDKVPKTVRESFRFR